MKSPFGRPIKYGYIIAKLEDDTLYSPATIARFAAENGLLSSSDPETQAIERKRIRLALGRLASSREFPPFGDGTVNLKGQPPTPAWYGWRWRSAIA